MLENFNTNISYILMYGSLSYYIFIVTDNIYLFLLGFFAITFKLLYRYTRMHARNSFKEELKNAIQAPIMTRYKNSIKAKVKFFISKSLFASNFYFAVYLISFIFVDNIAWVIFIVYTSLDLLINMLFIIRIFFRKYERA